MANEYYSESGQPGTGSTGASATMRSEFTAVGNGFDLLPTLAANGGKFVKVNAGATALEAVAGGVATADIAADAVTYAKIQNVSATDKILGRSTAGAGDVEEIACTAAGRDLLDDANAAAQRTTLGLAIGTNVQAYDATYVVDADIGVTVQAYDADLTTWGGKAAPSGTVVGTTDTQTLTGKTIGMAGALDCNNNVIQEIKTATFSSYVTLTTTTGAVTIDWTAAQNYLQNEPTGNITYTFTAPPGPCHMQLFIASDGTSLAKLFTWPSVTWIGTTWTGVDNKKAIINFWYDGTNYYAMGSNQP